MICGQGKQALMYDHGNEPMKNAVIHKRRLNDEIFAMTMKTGRIKAQGFCIIAAVGSVFMISDQVMQHYLRSNAIGKKQDHPSRQHIFFEALLHDYKDSLSTILSEKISPGINSNSR
jgi:hypothetical protein